MPPQSARFRRLASYALLLLSSVLFDKVHAQETALTKVVRVGYVTFDGPKKQDDTLQSLIRYLQFLSDESRKGNPAFRKEVDFAISLGNYYQTFSWLQSEDLDAAIVSSFTASLLDRDNVAVPLVELRGNDHDLGHYPVIAASGKGREDPEKAYKEYLEALWAEAQNETERREDGQIDSNEGIPNKNLNRYKIYMVTHLSSTGFIAPILYAEHWLVGKTASNSPKADEFWKLFFQKVIFKLNHTPLLPQRKPDEISFAFSYWGRPISDREAAEKAALGLGDWEKYDVLMPNDVLVVRPAIAQEIFRNGVIEQNEAQIKHLLPGDSGQMDAIFKNSRNYKRVQRYSEGINRGLRERIGRVFSSSSQNSELRRLNQKWFQEGRFDFTIGETIEFLQQDQKIHNQMGAPDEPRLSLVLPGGGVKSVYQAVLLDELYNNCYLLNGESRNSARCSRLQKEIADHRQTGMPPDDPCFQASPGETPRGRAVLPPQEKPLAVKNIVGTSGGAMVGLMAAAHLDPADKAELTTVVERMAGAGVFPLMDIPRWVSIFLLTVLLLLVLGLFKVIKLLPSRYHSRTPPFRPAPWQFSITLLGLLLAGPILVRFTWLGGMGAIPELEAALYGLSVLAIHFALTCSIYRKKADVVTSPPLNSASGRQASLLLVLGPACIVLALSARLAPAVCLSREEGLGSGISLCSSLASTGVLVTVIGIIFLVHAGKLGLTLEGVPKYLRAMSLIIIEIVLVYALLLFMVRMGSTTFLELTSEFWLWLIACGFLVAVGLALLARQPPGAQPQGLIRSYFHHAFLGLAARNASCSSTAPPGVKLVVLSGLGILFWTAIVAPAMYGSRNALQSFREALDFKILHANLVVTGTLLRDTSCDPGGSLLREGDIYFCFAPPGGECKAAKGGRWMIVDDPDSETLMNAAFASGSPFPVFPPHQVKLPNGCNVRLVDGGYAHNVPIEAGKLGDVRQVLIVQSTPAPREIVEASIERDLPLSQLLQYGGRIFPFLFSRAQELDRSAGRGLVVASLVPDPLNGSFPFLTDFRQATIERMSEAAHQDICYNRRIGSIESWGVPEMLAQTHGSSPRP